MHEHPVYDHPRSSDHLDPVNSIKRKTDYRRRASPPPPDDAPPLTFEATPVPPRIPLEFAQTEPLPEELTSSSFLEPGAWARPQGGDGPRAYRALPASACATCRPRHPCPGPHAPPSRRPAGSRRSPRPRLPCHVPRGARRARGRPGVAGASQEVGPLAPGSGRGCAWRSPPLCLVPWRVSVTTFNDNHGCLRLLENAPLPECTRARRLCAIARHAAAVHKPLPPPPRRTTPAGWA